MVALTSNLWRWQLRNGCMCHSSGYEKGLRLERLDDSRP